MFMVDDLPRIFRCCAAPEQINRKHNVFMKRPVQGASPKTLSTSKTRSLKQRNDRIRNQILNLPLGDNAPVCLQDQEVLDIRGGDTRSLKRLHSTASCDTLSSTPPQVSPRLPATRDLSISSQESALSEAMPLGIQLVSAIRCSKLGTRSPRSPQKHVSFCESVSFEERMCDSDADDDATISKQPVYII
eukprot:gnl/MRDRNA2_/MRDRNA2_27708_c0_seq1.p1 gnl/MRDRNA2_/MRDRNA2_27708_c0~~gnl/MRDRNA2_/MRDRNA2_27708_c0_seq1.p1  ORF type:complete len:189 (+),score=21.95 gnl/MRDRNA2_/MRDRNA2_27708_c0_seq1:93-659(+)